MFEPRILGFLCQWCGYAGADLAGVSRFKYPASLRVVRVMCSGRVDPAFVVDALAHGQDGVMVIGCHPGDCHYITGNYEALNMAIATRLLLEYSGISPKRFMLDWVSASEGARFSRLVTDFTATIARLGPLGCAESESEEGIADRLAAARAVAQQEKLRYLLGRVSAFVKKGNKYGERFTGHEVERMLAGVIADELLMNRILFLLQKRPLSIADMADALKQEPRRALAAVMSLKRKGKVEMSGIAGATTVYTLKPSAEVAHVG
ncbi:MAG: hydrogenase iron-sulfur subunit [Dehalococcoidia bacterium]|nr:hydrogenase iron-sulfur subunit [Dehalococcoidia bacterium]